jgi:hypothetical protein
MSKRSRKLIWIIPAAIVGIVIFIALGGALVMLLWNWLAPALFGLQLITFWQAVGLLALCRILFGGFGLGGGGSHRSRRHTRGRWEELTPEEQARFREGLRDRSARTTPLNSNPSV